MKAPAKRLPEVSRPRDEAASDGRQTEGRAPSRGKFLLEPLEPRVLLSADSILGEVYRSLLDDEARGPGAAFAVIVQEIDAATSAEIVAADRGSFGSAQTETKPSVAWPEGWQAGATDDLTTDLVPAASDEQQAALPAPEMADGQGVDSAQLEPVAVAPTAPENSDAGDDTAVAATVSQDTYTSNSPDNEFARGPPSINLSASALLAEDSLRDNDLGLSDFSQGNDGGPFAFQQALISTTFEDALARAPPVSDALTDQTLAPVLQEALRLWAASGLGAAHADRLSDLNVRIADLPAGQVGHADGLTITLDPTAAGSGWFVDPTPADDSEFVQPLGNFRSAAGADSPAFGRMDLLTVLVHEIGHVLGFDHDAGPAVMGASLAAGERVLLGDAASDLPAGAAPVTGALTLDASAFIGTDIQFQIINSNSNNTPDVQVTGAGANDNTYVDIDTILGSPDDGDTLEVGQDLAAAWELTGINAGKVTVTGFNSITFSLTENLTGAATAADTYTFKGGGAVSGTIDDRAGTLTLGVAGFVQVSGDYDFARQVLDLTYAGATSGTATGATVLTVGGTSGTGLIGVNAFDNPLGLQGTLTVFGLAVATDGTRAWNLFQGTITDPSFVGFGGDLDAGLANLTVTVNTGSNDTHLNTSADPIEVTTGGTPVSLNFSAGVIAASTTFSLTISDFVHLSGAFTFGVGQDTTADVQTGLNAATGLLVAPTLALVPTSDGSGAAFGRSADYTTLYNVPVSVFTVAASGVSLFVGYASNLDPGGDGVLQESELPADAGGLFAENVSVGFVLMSAKVTGLVGFDALGLRFYALKATADNIAILGVPGLDLSADNIEVRVNSGKAWIGAPTVTPTVDFVASFGSSGYAIQTGGTPISIAFVGPLIGASADRVLLRISDFVYVSGGFSFNKGPVHEVDIRTNLTGLLDAQKLPLFGTIAVSETDPGTLARNDAGTMIWNLPVQTIDIGLTHVDVFVGYAPDGVLAAAAANGDLTEAELEAANAIGLLLDDASLGMLLANAMPVAGAGTLNTSFLKFTALQADAATIALLGVPGLDLSVDNLQVRVNQGSYVPGPWPSTLLLPPPVIDFKLSFPDNSWGDEDDADALPDGYRVQTDTSGSFKALLFDTPVVGASADRVLLRISDFVYVSGGFSFNKGPVHEVDIRTNLTGLLDAQKLPLFGTIAVSETDPGTLARNDAGTMIWNLPVQTIDIGLTHVDVFVGYAPDGVLAAAAANGDLTEAELEAANAIGLLLDDASLGMLLANAMPVAGAGTLNTSFLKFTALQADAATIALLGVPGLDLSVDNLQVRVNQGSYVPGPWPSTLLLPPPVIDFKLSFPDNSWGDEDDADALPDGYRVQTDTSGSFKALLFDTPVVGASADRVLLRISDFVYVSGGFSFNKGPVHEVDIRTNLTGLLDAQKLPLFGTIAVSETDPGTLARNDAGTMIWNLPVQTIDIGLTHVDVFVGYAPDGVLAAAAANGDLTEAELEAANAIGLLLDDASLGMLLANAMPVAGAGTLNTSFLKFTALQADAATIALLGVPGLDLSVDNLQVRVNQGSYVPGPWPSTLLLPPPVIDFKLSFPDNSWGDEDDADALPDGYRVQTDTSGSFKALLFDTPVVGASADRVLLRISDFVYVSGGFSFNKGPVHEVDIRTNLTGLLDAQKLPLFGTIAVSETDPGTLARNDAGTMIWNLPVQTIDIGLTHVDVFVGYAPDGVLAAAAANGDLTEAELEAANAIGLLLDDASLGMLLANAMPVAGAGTLNTSFLKFTALQADAATIALLGVPGLDLSVDNLQVRVNQGSYVPGPWPSTLLLPPPVIDFKLSFPDNSWGDEDDADALPDGYRVQTDTSGSFKALLFDTPVVGASADRVLLRISDFVYVSGGFSFNKGPVHEVDIRTNLTGLLDAQKLPLFGTIAVSETDPGTLARNDAGTMIWNLPVQTIDIGLTHVDVFVGYAPDGVLAAAAANGDLTEAELEAANAIGLLLDDASLGMLLANAMPVAGAGTLNTSFLKFTALQADAATIALLGVPGLDLSVDNLQVRVNQGSYVPGPWPSTLLLPPPVIDFKLSFPDNSWGDEDDADALPDGYRVQTDTSGSFKALLFDTPVVGASADRVLLRISDFVYVSGGFSFNKGPVYEVDVLTHLTQLQAAGVLGTLPRTATDTGTLAATPDGSIIWNLPVQTIEIGLTNVDVFVGYAPDGVLADAASNGELTAQELEDANAIGLLLDEASLGMLLANALPVAVSGVPVVGLNAAFLKFTALQADAATIALLGVPGVELSATNLQVRVNQGSFVPGVWPAAPLMPPPVIDFKRSFPDNSWGDEDDADALPDGYRVQTNTSGAFKALLFDQPVIGASAENVTLRISEFIYITGSIAFEKGPVHNVQLSGGVFGGALEDVADLLEDFGLPADTQIPLLQASKDLQFLTVGASNVHAFIGMGGPYWVDTNGDGLINRNPITNKIVASEVNGDAVGLVIDDFDFGLAIMKPASTLDFGTYFALKASAEMISLEGIDDVTVQAEKILVEVNQSTPSVFGLSLFPVVNFASTYPSELQPLFNILAGTDGILNSISVADLNAALGPGHGVTTALTTVEQLLELLDHGGAPPPASGPDGLLSVAELVDALTDTFKTTTASGQTQTNLARILAADADGDEKFDPAGFEVNTGGTPVYLGMNSSLIRAQGFVELQILDNIFLTGSIAFELGPTQDVTLSNGDTRTVTTMTIGAANVTAFVGINGPYWTDDDGDHSVDAGELSTTAIGFHITDLDIGIMLMASVSIDPAELGVYLAAKLNVHSFGLVGIDGLTAAGAFDVELNIGIGTSGLAVVNFVESFSEAVALFDLINTNNSGASNGVLDAAEQNAALASGYIGVDITSVAQLVSLLDAEASSDPEEPSEGDGLLSIGEVLAKLEDSFEASHQAAIDGLDVDGNGRLNTGFEVNTGNPAAPVVLDFEEFLISIQLGGELELANVFRMYGVFLFEINPTGLKAFVAAGLEIGPDMGASAGGKLFTMNALGALVITGDGIAADVQISVTIGGALSAFLQLDATARLVFNTTGANQPITIPAKYVDFLLGEADVPASVDVDTTLLTGLVFTPEAFEQRFGELNPDGSATYTIPGGAPLAGGGNAPNGAYLLATFHGELIIASMFEITADFRLLLSSQRFELAFTGNIVLGGFGSFTVSGGAVVDDNGFAAYGGLSININFAGVLTLTGNAELKINTATSGDPVIVNGQPIAPNTYKVEIDATLTLFGFISATGDVEIGVENGVFSIEINELSIDLFILSVEVSGYIRSNGQFSLSGELLLDLEEGGFGITGGVGVSIGNSGFSGYGSVGIVVFGESFNIASAELSVNSERVFIRAEGPLSVYIEVTIHSNGDVEFDGGLGFLDDVIGAIEDVVDAVGTAIVDAVNAVGAALTQLGDAILELGAAIGDAIEGFINDVAGFIEDVGDWITGLFSSSRTVYNTFPQSPKYSYSAFKDGSILRINMDGGALTEVESPLALAVVNGQVIVDGPNVTRNVKVAEKQDQHRHWKIVSWGSWHNTGSPYGAVFLNIEYSNLMAFSGVTSIVITGTGGHDTIVLDANSMGTIPVTVFGGNGNDLIITGNGNDHVEGGEGNDRIFTNGGQDIAYGQGGDDVMVGGTGNDVLIGGTGNDKLDESQNRGNNPNVLLGEQNILDGGDGNDVILGSPGRDTIIGGAGNDAMMGLNHDDTYFFSNGYGADTFADYFAKSVLDFGQVSLNDYFGNPILSFGGVTVGQLISVTDDGLTVTSGGNTLFIEGFIAIGQHSSFDDFQIVRIRTGSGDDQVTITSLPEYRMDFVDTGGTDTYHLDLSQATVAQSVARVDIVDSIGNPDRINLDVVSTGFDIHLHPQAVLLNNLNLTFSTGVEQLSLTDHAAATTITTGTGFDNLLVKAGVTITSATGGQIELLARDNFTLQAGALITTTGDVIVRGDNDGVVDVAGAVIDLFGTINADHVAVYGKDDDDTVTVGNVTSGSETTISTFAGLDIVNIRTINASTTVNAGDGADTVNVGSNAAGTIANPSLNSGGTIDGIGALLTINGDTGTDVLNVDDTGDGNANTGALSATTITGLDMTGSIAYGTVETLNIGLGLAGDTFTITDTHAGVTNLNGNNGSEIVNIRAISGPTTVNGGSGDETFNVGSNAAGAVGNANNNTGGNVNDIGDDSGDVLTINGNDPTSGSDWLYVDDTGDTLGNTGALTSTQITLLGMGGNITYGTVEHLVISLGSGADIFTINSTHGAATSPFQEDTTLNTGAGTDTVHINDVTDLLFVNGQADGDTINVNGTGAGSVSTLNGDGGADTVNINDVTNLLFVNGGADADTVNVNGTGVDSVSTLNGDAGNDIFNIRAMNGRVDVRGGADSDSVNVTDVAPLLPIGPTTTPTGSIDAINALLDVDGGTGTLDIMNVDDSRAVNDKVGTLTATTLRGLELDVGIDYLALEKLNIWLGFGDNDFTVDSTHPTTETTVYSAQGTDAVEINDASGLLIINGEEDADTFNVRSTSPGSEVRINSLGGDDTFNLSDQALVLPGTIDGIDGLVVIDAGTGFDVINVDDSVNTANKAGTLTSNTLRGLEMPAGVNYTNAEDFNLWLGTGTDGLYIDSTHAGTTDVFAGDGNATVNQRDDTIAIRSVGGITTVHGQGGNDFFYVNVEAANDPNFYANFKLAAVAANDDLFNTLFHRTHANGLAAVLNLHGEGDTDQYTVNFAGQGNALVNVHDNGAPNNGVDTLIINGADVVAGLPNQPNDTFLLRRDFVALLNASVVGGAFDRVERVNYDENINARLIVNGLGGDDRLVADDNSSITTLDGGDGDDTFQIGQVFGTPRDAAAGLALSDRFDTTPVIIGVIKDPVTQAIIFDPTTFDPVTDVLSPATIVAINAAIDYQRELGLALDGVAYVSPGVSHATTVFGGAGADTFNVYHNTGALRLEGEADNDEFTVRAFVTLDLSVQGETEVNGGAGTDTINYAINAPVSLDGGAGFDKVVVLGTPFNDSFVVTSEGIFGAGLNVQFTNVEAAELDTLEGDDTIYVLGTSSQIITTVIGGLGDDTIQVMGDVINPIISSDLLGRSGVITQGLTSDDPDFDNAGVNGIAVNVLSASGDSLVNIQPTGTPLLVREDGAMASYFISLTDPATLGDDPVYLTVSAGVASSSDRRLPGRGQGVLVSTDGVTFTNAVVLTFDGATAANVFQIWVRAIDDSAAEGPRVALISHSINSDDTDFDDLAMVDIFVNVVDNDQPGLDLRHLTDTFAPDTSTEVLEGTLGFTDAYSVALTTAPGALETVTVTLLTDGQVSALSQGGLANLTFNSGNWSIPQRVFVTAVVDGLDGIELSTIRHQITNSGGSVYSGFDSTEYPELTVTVYDDETPGVVVQQTGGSTVVVEDGAGDTYRVRLTSAPTAPVTLTLRTDTQTMLSGGVTPTDESGTLGYFEYTYVFNSSNWHQWALIDVSANPDFTSADDNVMAFAPQDQNLDQIRGPLIIEGGVGAGEVRGLLPPVLLPGETNDASDQNSPASSESGDIDVLNVFHTDNNDADMGTLSYRTVDALGHAIANPGLALTGFEMGADVEASALYYGGGITFNGFEIVEVLLGKGNETLTIFDTGDRDEKNPAVTVDPATITAVHGGGGNDTIIANGRGDGPLVVYGDTSEDGARYTNDLPAASVHGTKFNNPGNDTIDASLMPDQADGFVGIVIYGGAGNDVIFGSQDDDHLAGGTGDDTIHARSGNDHVYSDSSFNVNLLLFARDQITPFDADDSEVNAMFTVPTAATAGADTVHGDAGNDTIFGDHGVIDQVQGTRRLQTTGFVTLVTTVEPSNGMADTIHGDGGDDVILGGNAGDTIDAGQQNNIVIGDLGYIDYVVLDGNFSDIDQIASTSTTDLGGADDITSGDGQDIIIGGRFGDTINAGNGDNLVIGDSGRITAAATGAGQLAGLPITLGLIETIEFDDGGVDGITTGSGRDIVLGGQEADSIDAGQGSNIVLGDHGRIAYGIDADASDIDLIESTSTTDFGGADGITSGDGQDIIIGGRFGDTINAGSGDNLVIGDSGRITAAATGAGQLAGLPITLGLIETIEFDDGGVDGITTGSGRDIVLGGQEADSIDAGQGSNIVLGDHGRIAYGIDADASDIDLIESTSTTDFGGADGITSGDGQDIIIGGRFGDTINAGSGDNLVIGDSGRITAAATGAGQLAGLPITLGLIETIEFDDGGVDGITTGSGRDIVLGGQEADSIDAGQGSNIVLGDHGRIAYGIDADASDIDLIESTSTTDFGGADGITSGDGQDIIIGGRFGDTINAGSGDNLVIGDSGRITAAATGAGQLAGLPITLGLIETITYVDGGRDAIVTGAGNDIVLGGAAGDDIRSGADSDIVHGDNALLSYVSDVPAASATLDVIDTLANNIGGNDTIRGEAGDDVLIGGTGDDRIDGGSEEDLIFGDNVNLDRSTTHGILTNPRFRALLGTEIYASGEVLIDAATWQLDPRGMSAFWGDFRIALEDHADDTADGLYGDDYIAGGANDDQIFGQLGDDTIQGDGSIESATDVDAYRNGANELVVIASFEAVTDGDDYIEGNGGADVIFGNLGQDDIIGGSSSLFNLVTPAQRPDGADILFGGAGSAAALARNGFGDLTAQGHARDADVIAGDNANIYRLVGISGHVGVTAAEAALGYATANGFLKFNYDNYAGTTLRVIPRPVQLLDYTAGGPDYAGTTPELLADIGAADELHGESGDDVIYGMVGNDVLFGEGQDDDLIGGWGHDWISGGTGDDGVLGDDGRIYTSRNGTSTPEPLYGLAGEGQRTISTPGNHNVAVIFPAGLLNKTVDLTPFNVIDADSSFQDPLYDAQYADDIIFGGLGNDFLHGGSGDDAISGAEAQASAFALVFPDDDEDHVMADGVVHNVGYDTPSNPGHALSFEALRGGEFALYDEFNPMRRIVVAGGNFFLNFDAVTEGGVPIADGADMIFGDLGNDWLVGGTDRDWMFGGFGADLLNADDVLTTAGGENTSPDGPQASYEDFAYGGAGRDVLIGNTGGDRLIDWAGEFNSYLVPFSPFGMSTVSRMISPALQQFLYDLSYGAGADRTRAADTGEDPARNGEPHGEIGLVNQSDNWWQDQTGAPDDPQPGNTNGKKDVLRSADFNNGSTQGFAADSGTWTVQGGALFMSATTPSGDAVTIYHVGEQLPSYYELQATINAVKPTAGWKANSYVIFDYHSPTDFKFAGINVSLNQIQLGHRTADGWIVDKMAANVQLKPDTFYNMLVAVNGLVVTVTVNNTQSFSYAFAPRMIDGVPSNLNWGYVGFGSENARGKLDNIQVKVLERPFTLITKETFDDGTADLFNGLQLGSWQVGAGLYAGSDADPAMSLVDLGLEKGIQANARTELTVTLSTAATAGFVFDLYSSQDFKFVLADVVADRIFIGHFARGAWTIDASAAVALNAGTNHKLLVSLSASTVSVMVDDKAVVGHAFNAVVVDGAFGTLTRGGSASFDDFTLKTSDSRFSDSAPEMLLAATVATVPAPVDGNVTQAQLDQIVAAAVDRWSAMLGADVAPVLDGVVFVIGDLKGQALAQRVGNVVVLDVNAAGHGWFIDPSPYDDSEFSGQSPSGALKAPASSPAYNRMDLLSVVMHEIGHLLDFGHNQTSATVMSATLEAGTRVLTIDGSAAGGGSGPALPAEVAVPASVPSELDPAPPPANSGPGRGRRP